jgi:hypothetical protein
VAFDKKLKKTYELEMDKRKRRNIVFLERFPEIGGRN